MLLASLLDLHLVGLAEVGFAEVADALETRGGGSRHERQRDRPSASASRSASTTSIGAVCRWSCPFILLGTQVIGSYQTKLRSRRRRSFVLQALYPPQARNGSPG